MASSFQRRQCHRHSYYWIFITSHLRSAELMTCSLCCEVHETSSSCGFRICWKCSNRVIQSNTVWPLEVLNPSEWNFCDCKDYLQLFDVWLLISIANWSSMRKNLKCCNLELEWGSPIKDSQCQLLPQIITTTVWCFPEKSSITLHIQLQPQQKRKKTFPKALGERLLTRESTFLGRM